MFEKGALNYFNGLLSVFFNGFFGFETGHRSIRMHTVIYDHVLCQNLHVFLTITIVLYMSMSMCLSLRHVYSS